MSPVTITTHNTYKSMYLHKHLLNQTDGNALPADTDRCRYSTYVHVSLQSIKTTLLP